MFLKSIIYREDAKDAKKRYVKSEIRITNLETNSNIKKNK